MSLIQEALRRKDDDDGDPSIPARIKLPMDLPAPPRQAPARVTPTGAAGSAPRNAGQAARNAGQAAAKTAASPAPTPPVPVAVTPPPVGDRGRVKVASLKPVPPPPRGRSAWPAVVGLVVVALLLVGGAVALLTYSARFVAGTATAPAKAPGVAVASAPGPETASAVAVEAGTSATEPGPGEEDVLLPTGRAVMAAAERVMPGQPSRVRERREDPLRPVEPEPEPRAAEPVAQAANGPVASRVAVPPPTASSSQWPRLKLDGVMARPTPRDGSAMINGSIVEAGERVQGVRLVEVTKSGALFEYRGQTQFVRVGQTTL